MQISRHWRMNKLRYRLEGVRLENGDVAIHPGGSKESQPTQVNTKNRDTSQATTYNSRVLAPVGHNQ